MRTTLFCSAAALILCLAAQVQAEFYGMSDWDVLVLAPDGVTLS